ncbi:MAG: dienelactone hydrolase family protein [Pseudomonadota bacterium]|nr:dienelactone hydrolase family protein [Pseudomonadota bacterium]
MQAMTNFSSGGTTIPAELYNPAGTPNGGVVVIAYGSDGMNDPWATMIRDYAIQLSQKGFVALIPDYFVSTGTKSGLALDAIPIHRDTWQTAVADAVAHAKTLPSVNASRVGLLGFSLGGHLCLRLRATAKVLVEFFAPELAEFGGLGLTKSLTLHAQIHHGLADNLVPFHPNADNIDKTPKTEGLFRN